MAARKDAVSKKTAAKIEKLAEAVLKVVEKGKNPFLDIPVRSLANANWSEKTRLRPSWRNSARLSRAITSPRMILSRSWPHCSHSLIPRASPLLR